MSISIVRHH